MTFPRFSRQETVRLAIGGPEMVVEGPGTLEGQVWCTWQNGQLFHGGSFEEKALIRVHTPLDKADVAKSIPLPALAIKRYP